MRVNPKYREIRVSPVQVVNDCDVACAVTAGGQQALRLVFDQERSSRPELLDDRCPAIDPAPGFARARIGHTYDWPIPAADFRRGFRPFAEIFPTARPLPLRVGQDQINCWKGHCATGMSAWIRDRARS